MKGISNMLGSFFPYRAKSKESLNYLEDPLGMGITERIVPQFGKWGHAYPIHIQRYEFVGKQMSKGACVLDAGCGTGYGSAFLSDKGAGRIVAVDISSGAINFGRKHFRNDRIIWVEDDCHTLKNVTQYGPFDIVCCLENLEHLQYPEQFLRRVTQLLKPDGKLIVSVPNRIWNNKMVGISPTSKPII